MEPIFKTILLALFGLLTGVLVFGLWQATFFYVYGLIKGPFPLFEIAFLGTRYVKRPLYEGFTVGAFLGFIPGLLTGFFISLLGDPSLQKGALFGLISTEVFILGAYFLIVCELNPITFILEMITLHDLYSLIYTSLALFIPSIITGLITREIMKIF